LHVLSPCRLDFLELTMLCFFCQPHYLTDALADLQDLPCRLLNPNINIKDYLPQPPASASSQSVEDYAYITLRLLDAIGPAGGLHQQWVEWNQSQPELLERLTEHSEKLNYLLTPAAIPNQFDRSNEQAYHIIVDEWKRDGWSDRNKLQAELLRASNTARYPHAFLIKQLLDKELASVTASWHEVWDSLLREEMERGRSATYQLSLSLRLLLARKGYGSRRKIAEDLMNALLAPSKQQKQALTIIFNIYYRSQNISDNIYMHQSLLQLNLLHMVNTLCLIDILEKMELEDEHELLLLQITRNKSHLMENPLDDLRYELGRETVIRILCNVVEQRPEQVSSTLLLAMYSIIADSPLELVLNQYVQDVIKEFAKQIQFSAIEHRLIIKAILRQLTGPKLGTAPSTVPPLEATDQVLNVRIALIKRHRLTKSEVMALLAACAWGEQKSGRDLLQLVELLDQQFNIEETEALPVVIKALEDNNVEVCAAASRLLQHSKALPSSVRHEAAQKIMQILSDSMLSHPHLDTLDNTLSRFDDILFEALRALVR
jgi:hypothetical protein